MELRIESAEDSSQLPSGCFVGVRIGETLKQGRYEPQRCYHFPQVDRRRNAKIDLYQHVGTCTVAVDPDAKSNHDVAVTSTNPSWPGLRLKVHVQSKSDDTEKKQREQRVKSLKTQANDYLSKHNIEERLSEAVKALLKEQPSDPTEFLCRALRVDGAPAAANAIAPVAAPQQKSTKQVVKGDALEEIRQQASAVLVKASENGELINLLNDIKKENEAPVAAPARAQAAPVFAAAAPARSSAPTPAMPVKANLGPPAMMISSVSVCGPAFSSMGMRPAMLFI